MRNREPFGLLELGVDVDHGDFQLGLVRTFLHREPYLSITFLLINKFLCLESHFLLFFVPDPVHIAHELHVNVHQLVNALDFCLDGFFCFSLGTGTDA